MVALTLLTQPSILTVICPLNERHIRVTYRRPLSGFKLPASRLPRSHWYSYTLVAPVACIVLSLTSAISPTLFISEGWFHDLLFLQALHVALGSKTLNAFDDAEVADRRSLPVVGNGEQWGVQSTKGADRWSFRVHRSRLNFGRAEGHLAGDRDVCSCGASVASYCSNLPS